MMSGGSLDYICYKVEDTVSEIKDRTNNPLFIAFANHLIEVADVLHALEWNFSGDWNEDRAIEKVKKFFDDSDKRSLEVIKNDLENTLENIKMVLEK